MITKNEMIRVKASVTYPGEAPINIMPILTSTPVAYIDGLLTTYEDAEIEVWEVDIHGNAISAATKAGKAGKEKAVQQFTDKPIETKEKKPPPGMAQF